MMSEHDHAKHQHNHSYDAAREHAHEIDGARDNAKLAGTAKQKRAHAGHSHKHDSHAHGSNHRGHDHSQGHSHGSSNEHRLSLALGITGIFLLIEACGALLSHSLALLADAGHMLTDAASLVLALVALRASRKPADQDYSYGRHRFEVLAAFVNGLALLAISLWILIESLLRLATPEAVDGKIMLVIAALGVGANLGAFLVLRDGEDNINLRGAVLHVLSDLLGSAAAMIAAVIILISGWTPIDPLLSALVSVLILRSGWRVTRQSARILLEGTPAGLDAGEVASDLLAKIGGLAGVHHVHAWSLTDERPMLTLHAVVKIDADRDGVLSAVHQRLHDHFGIVHATVQLETVDCGTTPHAASCA